MQELLFIKLGSPGGRLASYKDPEVLALYLRHCLSFLRSSSPSSCAGFNVRQALPEWWSSYISSAKLLQKSDDSTEPGSVARGCSTLTDQIWACAHPRSPLGVPLEPHGLWVCVCGGAYLKRDPQHCHQSAEGDGTGSSTGDWLSVIDQVLLCVPGCGYFIWFAHHSLEVLVLCHFTPVFIGEMLRSFPTLPGL